MHGDQDLGVAADALPVSRRPVLERIRAASSATRLAAVADAQSRPTPAVVDALAALAVDSAQDAIVRAAAIAALARSGRSVAIAPDAPPAVRSAAAKATRILAMRELVARFDSGGADARLATARTLPAPPTGEAIEPFELPAREQARVRETGSLRAGAATTSLGLRCAGRELAIVWRPDRLAADELLAAPGHPAQVAVRHVEEEDEWTVRFDVLTAPQADGSVALAALDEGGTTHLAGTARRDGEGVAFEVRAAERPGAVPLAIAGRVVERRVVIDRAWFGGRATPRRRPTRG